MEQQAASKDGLIGSLKEKSSVALKNTFEFDDGTRAVEYDDQIEVGSPIGLLETIPFGGRIHYILMHTSRGLMEFTGTMMFVMCIVLSSTSGDPLAPLSIGFSLMILIFMGSHVSGSHYNPAVTFGVWLSGRQQIPFYRACLYMLAQVAGGLCGAGIALGIEGNIIPASPGSEWGLGDAFGFELLWSFILVNVVLNVATLKDSTGNSFYGLAIGGTVFVGAVMGGRISGACFNPAVGIGLAAVAKGATGKSSPVWIYILAPMVGSCVAAFYFRITNYKEYMLRKAQTKKGLKITISHSDGTHDDQTVVLEV